MDYEMLESHVRAGRWTDLESAWLTVTSKPGAAPDKLLPLIDKVVESGQAKLAETMGWAWLSSMKENHSPQEALRLGRGLLLRLPDGEQLRDEILTLYRETHKEHPELDRWVDRSGLKEGKSVRRALRYLDVGLRLKPGMYLVNRSEDEAAEVIEADLDAEEVVLQTARRKRTLPLSEVINDFDLAEADDFHVLEQLHPERIGELFTNDPLRLVIGIVKAHRNEMDRDALKLILVPRYIPTKGWSDFWSRIRDGVKKSAHLRIEGRSPMFLIYDPVGKSLEDETWAGFSAATAPRQWLEILEGYLRDTKHRKQDPNPGFLNRVQKSLTDSVNRFRRHKEHQQAFATALVIERLAADGLPISTDAHGMALEMLKSATDPVSEVASVPDAALWSLAVDCVEQVYPDSWPAHFAQLILYCPAGMCDTLAKKVEAAGQGERLKVTAAEAMADPGQFTDAAMWLWKGPGVKTELDIPPLIELFNELIALVGPTRMSEGKASGQTIGDMRAKVRAGFSARDYARFREMLKTLELPMAQTIRRQLERAEGLGPTVQGEMLSILTEAFPKLYAKREVAMWDDDSVLYFTRDGLRTKESELEELVNVKMRENAKAIGEAAALGDLSENSEYKFALEERDLLRARVAQLNSELALAKLLEPDNVPTDHVAIGQRITLRATGGGEPLVIFVMGAGDSDLARGVYGYQTPIARQMMGKRIGETATVALGGTDERTYEIVAIENALQMA